MIGKKKKKKRTKVERENQKSQRSVKKEMRNFARGGLSGKIKEKNDMNLTKTPVESLES